MYYKYVNYIYVKYNYISESLFRDYKVLII